MHIEDRLANIETQLGTVIGLLQSGAQIAGAGADPVVAQQVNAAIAAAGGVSGAPTQTEAAAPKRQRGRPAKTETAPPVTTPPAAAPAIDPFATDDAPTAPAEPTRSLDDVRVALIVFQAKNDQQKALGLLKTAGSADNLQQLKPENYGKVFTAAIPAGKLDINDVKAVLVKAEERRAQGGFEVLKKFGAENIKQLKEENFAAVIIAAHGVK
jgi:hypothetical protein